VYFTLFATSFHFGYLFWYLYLYFYVAVVIIKFVKKNQGFPNGTESGWEKRQLRHQHGRPVEAGSGLPSLLDGTGSKNQRRPMVKLVE